VDLGLDHVPTAVSGASRGLGRAVAFELAREGARVAICSRDRAAIEEAAAEIAAATGTDVIPIAADVSSPADARRFVDEAAEALRGLQVLVANAGGPPTGPAASFGDDDWARALDLNFLSAVRMSTRALPLLKERPWGRIVCITSYTVRQPPPEFALSTAARAATTGFAKTLSREVAASGITVNTVLPGYMATDRLRSLRGAPADAGPEHPAFASIAAEVPLGRIGLPEEVAAAVAFLCSARASYVNGVNLQVDGGRMGGLL
jgi:3-oxoacyl-[acyl-carrier protein] reductase